MNSQWARRWALAAVCVCVIAAVAVIIVQFGLESAAALVGIVLAVIGGLAAFARWLYARPQPENGRRVAVKAWVIVAVVLMVAIAGVGGVLLLRPDRAPPENEPPYLTGSGTLRVLAGVSLIADLQPILAEAEAKTKVKVELVAQTGTLSAVEEVLSGKAAAKFDAMWLPSNSFLVLQAGASGRIATSTPIATSPVVLGLRESLARQFGWHDRPPTWAEIAEKAAQDLFTYGMTNPAASNSGYCALVGVASALADTRGPLTIAQIDRERNRLKDFFDANTLTSGSSGWLSSAFLARSHAGVSIDGLITYESELIKLNASDKLKEKLTLIFPSNGQVVADFPLTLLANPTEQARRNYEALVDYLTRKSTQRRIAELTKRRPAVDGVSLSTPFMPQRLDVLAFPDRADVASRLLTDFGDQLRKRARTIYLLDVSGSMLEPPEKLEALKASLRGLAGADESLAGLYSRFNLREEVHLIPFSGNVKPGRRVDLSGNLGAGQQQIIQFVNGLAAEGQTALYDALLAGYELAERLIAESPGFYTSIVLMTDGEKTAGHTREQFEQRYGQLVHAKAVPTFTVLFGESKAGPEMEAVASLTGGRVFDARSTPLSTVFKEVRGFQ